MTSARSKQKHQRVFWSIPALLVLIVLAGWYFVLYDRIDSSVLANGETTVVQDVPSNYEVEDIHFEPMAAGRNEVSITIHNLTDQDRLVGVQIQTNTRRAGWGSSYSYEIAPKETKQCNAFFQIRDEFIDSSWVRLRFFNATSQVYSPEWGEHFLERKFYGAGLERRKPDTIISLPVTAELASAITSRFQEFQNLLRDEKYEDVWDFFTIPCQQADFHSWKIMVERRLNKSGREGEQILSLTPKEVVKQGSLLVLHATLEDAEWKFAFADDGGQWKIDSFEGYVEQDQRERILGSMEHRTAHHFDIYYKKNSAAEREIDQIAEARDSGFDQICQFLGIESDVRILLVFFEDMESKRQETGHQGAGMASGTNIVEVYNDEIKLDPFHETTHILSSGIGSPPAIFNEGLATYMSERLASPPLKNLGGGESSLYERVRENKSKGNWIPLKELLTYMEIGPDWSKPTIAYPEAGSFNKFLVDTYGKEKFLQAYASLSNSKIKSVHEQNEKKLEKIFGVSLADLEEQWIKAFTAG